jgi:MoaA/NifB/PqqE/SkfB family radical SAM enzyme
MSYFNLSPAYAYKLKLMPRGSIDPINNKCTIPYKHVTIDLNSNCLVCTCDGWLPIPVGKVRDFDSLDDVWNSPIAKLLQKDIDDKKFSWCATDHCGIKHRNIIANKYTLALNIDESCNLHCPSCRRDQIMLAAGDEMENKQQDLLRILSWLENFPHPIHIIMSGNGDPLASNVIRPLFLSYQPLPNQTFKLFTNGLLIKKQLLNSQLLPNITEYSISVDAGSPEVYKNVRRGGRWDILLENFDFLSELKKNHLVTLNFGIQKSNYEDLFNFLNLCNKYSFAARIHQLDDWGTWNTGLVLNPDEWTIKNGTLEDHDVLCHTHPEYNKCVDIVNSAIAANKHNKKITFLPRLKSLIQ